MTNLTEAYLTYALKDGELINIEEVDNGLDCGCVCPHCKTRLVARNKGIVKAHHFAHYNAEDCGKSYETSLHLLSKKILSMSKNNQIMLPSMSIESYYYTGKRIVNILGDPKNFVTSHYEIWKGRKVPYSNVRVEEPLGEIIPDITIYSEQDKPLAIEIFVTHKIDENKLRKIRELNLPTIEIDLSEFNRSITEEELAEILIESTQKKKWIYSPYVETFVRHAYKFTQKLNTRYYYGDPVDSVVGCPLKKGRVFVTTCWECEYNFSESVNDNTGERCEYCLAKAKLNSIGSIKEAVQECKSNNEQPLEYVENMGSVDWAQEYEDEQNQSRNKAIGYSIPELWVRNYQFMYLHNVQTDEIICVFHCKDKPGEILRDRVSKCIRFKYADYENNYPRSRGTFYFMPRNDESAKVWELIQIRTTEGIWLKNAKDIELNKEEYKKQEASRLIEEEKKRQEIRKQQEDDERESRRIQELAHREYLAEVQRLEAQEEEYERLQAELEEQRRQEQEKAQAERREKFRQTIAPYIEQENKIIRDPDDPYKRWVKCKVCGKIDTDDKFGEYRGNIGTCRECEKNKSGAQE